MKYTNERNILILIALMKKHNVRKIVISPGAMNVTFVGSVQNDDYFQIYSCVDERSACYMACGLAEESGEPVALSCTGATSSRNYLPGLTEAYYRKLPILAITSTLHYGYVGQNIPQILDRTVQLNDTVKYSVQIPSINNSMDDWAVTVNVNKALLELKHNGCGPVHINLGTSYSSDYSVMELPNVRMIQRYNQLDSLPTIECSNVAIFSGAHSKWSEEMTDIVDQFCEKYNAVVLCDRTSNYFGKYKIMANIIFDQESYSSSFNSFDLLIHIGNISGAYMPINAKNVWRVNPDGEIRDTFKKLTNVFEMEEIYFFEKYVEKKKTNKINTRLYNDLNNEYKRIVEKLNNVELPFSNLWSASKLIKKLSEESILHLAILNSLRAWNYFDTDKKIYGYSNTGGFGIDGILSTAIGASFVNPKKNIYCVIGDLAFFYDMNSLGNININSNLRILLVNNGCGTEFHNYSHSAQVFGNKVEKYIAADGHFGNKSPNLVKNYVESLGYEYISATNKVEFEDNIDFFVSNEIYSKPLVFEIFTNSDDESEALKIVRNCEKSITGAITKRMKDSLNNDIKNKIKKIIGK